MLTELAYVFTCTSIFCWWIYHTSINVIHKIDELNSRDNQFYITVTKNYTYIVRTLTALYVLLLLTINSFGLVVISGTMFVINAIEWLVNIFVFNREQNRMKYISFWLGLFYMYYKIAHYGDDTYTVFTKLLLLTISSCLAIC